MNVNKFLASLFYDFDQKSAFSLINFSLNQKFIIIIIKVIIIVIKNMINKHLYYNYLIIINIIIKYSIIMIIIINLNKINEIMLHLNYYFN